jgi:hypothetical protein
MEGDGRDERELWQLFMLLFLARRQPGINLGIGLGVEMACCNQENSNPIHLKLDQVSLHGLSSARSRPDFFLSEPRRSYHSERCAHAVRLR